MQSYLRLAFFSAALFAFVMAILPHPPQLPGTPSDKLQHIAAFAVLGGLAAMAFTRASVVRLFAWLTAFGALIEIVQAIPSLNRDSDWVDLLADMIAALVAIVLVRWAIDRLTKAAARRQQ